MFDLDKLIAKIQLSLISANPHLSDEQSLALQNEVRFRENKFMAKKTFRDEVDRTGGLNSGAFFIQLRNQLLKQDNERAGLEIPRGGPGAGTPGDPGSGGI